MSKVLTISIAAYNMQDYLARCLDSLVAPEIMDDIEVLIINDGSKDNTLEIAREYEEKYPNTFKVVDKPNGGHGSTVNKGIELATGKYFKLLDADDWFDTSSFIKLIGALKQSNCDLVACDYSLEYVYENRSVIMASKNVCYSMVYDLKKWNGILKWSRPFLELPAITYRTALLQNNAIRIAECFYADIEYVCFPLKYVSTVVFYDFNVYKYFIGRAGQSVSKEGATRYYQDHLRICKEIVDYYINNANTGNKTVDFIHLKIALTKIVDNYTCLMFLYTDQNKARALLAEFDAWLKDKSTFLYNEASNSLNLAKVIKPIKLWRKNKVNIYQTDLYLVFRKLYHLIKGA
jgi:glycosyltransferase involved in cell wall biosynthesis